jgi:hypothetical protein
LPPALRPAYIKKRNAEFKKLCRDAARAINQDAIDAADPMTTNLKHFVHPIPNANSTSGRLTFPTRPNKEFPSGASLKAVYARAYRVTVA